MTHLVATTRSDQRILAIVEPLARSMGYDVVRLHLCGGETKSLQVLAEREDGMMDINDCAVLSRAISVELDVRDPIAGTYSLEISSPGIDRPLTKPGHFRAWIGHEARIEVAAAIEGQTRFRGQLVKAEEETIHLETDAASVVIDFANIRKAKLVLTDALLKVDRADGQFNESVAKSGTHP